MGFRTVYGNTISEDGWRMVDQAECTWSIIPGTNNVSIQLRSGVPTTIMVAFAAQFNARIEGLRDADTAGWTETNSVATSNHLAGTAMDLNWDSHPFHVAGTYGDRLPALRALLDEFEGTIFWGGDWEDPIDEMHFQCGFPEGDQRMIDKASQLAAAHGPPVQPPTSLPPALSRQDRYALATITEGQRLGITPRGIKIALSVELVETNLTMYANSNDPPSLDLPHDAVGSDHMSSGLFQQQTSWGSLADRMDPTASARIFFTVDNGPGVRGLTKIRDDNDKLYDYNDASNTPGFYAQTVQGSAYPDRYDERFADASALYDRLATTGGFLMALSDDEQREMLDLLRQQSEIRRVSRSPLRHLGETEVETISGFAWNTDGSVHVLLVEQLAMLGHPDSLALLNEVANADPRAFPERQDDAKLAQAILNKLAAVPAAPVYVPPPIYAAPAIAPVAIEAPPMPPGPGPVTPVIATVPGGTGIVSNLSGLNDEISGVRSALSDAAGLLKS